MNRFERQSIGPQGILKSRAPLVGRQRSIRHTVDGVVVFQIEAAGVICSHWASADSGASLPEGSQHLHWVEWHRTCFLPGDAGQSRQGSGLMSQQMQHNLNQCCAVVGDVVHVDCDLSAKDANILFGDGRVTCLRHGLDLAHELVWTWWILQSEYPRPGPAAWHFSEVHLAPSCRSSGLEMAELTRSLQGDLEFLPIDQRFDRQVVKVQPLRCDVFMVSLHFKVPVSARVREKVALRSSGLLLLRKLTDGPSHSGTRVDRVSRFDQSPCDLTRLHSRQVVARKRGSGYQQDKGQFVVRLGLDGRDVWLKLPRHWGMSSRHLAGAFFTHEGVDQTGSVPRASKASLNWQFAIDPPWLSVIGQPNCPLSLSSTDGYCQVVGRLGGAHRERC